MATDDAARLISGEAWSDFCDRMKALGARIFEDDFPGTPRDRAEGIRHLSRTVPEAMQRAFEFSDPDFPAFYSSNDDVSRHDGPNVDNRYLNATIRGDASYRISGRVPPGRRFILQVTAREAFLEAGSVEEMAALTDTLLGAAGPFPGHCEERSASDFEYEPDGSFEIVLSADERPGNWVPLHPEATDVRIREYFEDWAVDEPGWFRIENLASEGRAPAPLEPERAARMLEAAARWAEASTIYWNDYLLRNRANNVDNQLSEPGRPGYTDEGEGGAASVTYGRGFFDLAEDEALLFDTEPPDAQYWSVQLYNLGWFESLDFANRQCSLNHTQARIDEDGRVRIVIAHRDPGVHNWLDTEGYRSCMVSYRWVWTKTAPHPQTRVVKFEEILDQLPASTPRVDAAERRAQIAVRQAHVARRFRP